MSAMYQKCPVCPVFMSLNKKEKFSSDYDKYIDSIYRFVYIKVNSQYIAEDICSDIFTKYWKNIKNDKQIDNERAFLYKIARNTVIDYYRKKGITPNFVSSDDIKDTLKEDDKLEQNTDVSFDMQVILANVSNLKDDYQNVIIWHYLDDLSIKEIADALNKSESSVRMTLSRALSQLRKNIKEI